MQTILSPLQKLNHSLLDEKKVSVYVKRDDLIHPEIMGNKWRKLKYNILHLQRNNLSGIVTFGGAFSNHISAVAAAGRIFRFKTVGIIRGEELTYQSNPTLLKASQDGMDLYFVSRLRYRELKQNPSELEKVHHNFYLLPEGGTNDLAIRGCEEIVSEIQPDFDTIATAIGTGGTLAGILKSTGSQVIGISSLKGNFMKGKISNLLSEMKITKSNYDIKTQYHYGGYGKTSPELLDFIHWFKEYFQIPLDPIYTGKCFSAIWNMIKQNTFRKGYKIVLLHSGGLRKISSVNR